jgi:glycine betaine/proline transport system substrate-binding protein
LRKLVLLLCLTLLIASPAFAAKRSVTIAYTGWASSTASANLMRAVLQEKLGRTCELVATDAQNMWRMVAEGEADAMLSAWLPETQDVYFEQYGSEVENLGPNLEGTRIGLVVPKVPKGRFTTGTGIKNRIYVPTTSIPELGKDASKYDNRIIGIDPGAGVMDKTREALEVYGLKDKMRLVPGSDATMVAELSRAVSHQRWIVVTGWKPHWMFARWNLEFLDDPEGVYGQGGHIATMVRKGLQQEDPDVYALLNNFYWTPKEMGRLMLWIQEDRGLFPYDKALRWMNTHSERVESWLP